MNSRRNFLKIAATGAVLLGAQSKLGLAELLDQHKSRVVVARDAELHSAEGHLDEKFRIELFPPCISRAKSELNMKFVIAILYSPYTIL